MITINGFVLDASLTESHGFESEVTDYPVESGASITDNVRPKPIVVSIEGIVSDSPIGPVANIRAASRGVSLSDIPDDLPSETALAALLRIRDAREPVTIVTSLKTFDNMAMINLDIPRDGETGHALRFTATFQQIIYITNARTLIKVSPPTSTGLGKKKDLGPKTTYDLAAGAQTWHHSEPLPRWSTSEIVGYNASDVQTKGTAGYYRLNGEEFTQEDLDQYNADERAYLAEHDNHGNLLPQSDVSNQANNAIGSGTHSTVPVFRQSSGQWVDAAGTPVAQNPTYGNWYETAPSYAPQPTADAGAPIDRD